MYIRVIDLHDLDSLLPLFDAYRQFYRKESDLIGAKEFLHNRVENNEAIVFGAFVDDFLVGFTLLYPLFSSVRMKPIFLLNDLFVHPDARNKAIGKNLLRHAQEYAKSKNYAGVLLETEKTNDIGNHLYPAMGFQLESETNFYFWENISS
ncbi:MAG: GNAT family N-acetyltransferase [Saprospiraceae bacterium]|nr:GNAT family N-acetyltransferase [Saprospiraceae bacterium]